MSFYEGLAPGSTLHLLATLEANKMLLCIEDQGFVDGCRLTLDEGGKLTPPNHAQLQRIAKTINTDTPNMAGIATSEPVLTTLKVLQDLAGAKHTLNQDEMRFANLMAKKYNQKAPMTLDEQQKLLTLYTLKGF